nr:putative ribonuclease H-like domain-containing protein [Tanacetum cinerariifolium]
MKGIKREFSVARTPQQNGVAERKNRNLIEAARTMLADSLLPIPFWAEVVNTACYVQNRVLVTKPHNKTPYELLLSRTPSIRFMRPFGCPVTILNTLDPQGKFDGKADEGFLVRYSVSSKAFRVFDSRTRIVQETLHINFLENQPNIAGSGPTWLFDIDTLTHTNSVNVARTPVTVVELNSSNSTNNFNAIGLFNTAVSPTFEIDDEEDVGADADFFNLKTSITVSPIPTTRVHKDHPATQIIGDLSSSPQTRSMERMVKKQGGLTQINDEDFHTCMLGTIKEEVYVCQPLGFEDSDYPDKVYVDDIIFGSTKNELCKLFERLIKDKFQMSSMGELTFFLGLQVKQKDDGIFISQDKYVAEILRKFGLTDGKSASTPIDTEKRLLKDPDGEDVDVHIYRYLKGKPHLGLWYPKDSPFNLVAYSDSDYAGASLDRKSTIGGCQFLCCRLISWQCKKQTVVVTSSTEVEYVAAASCCAQVLWIQNQLILNVVSSKLILFGLAIDAALLMLLGHKSDASEGFDQIVDFLNAHVIQYALMVNPTIYVSCINQFWTSVSIKKSNDVVRLQALIVRKKVIITEDIIRQALRLDDADGVDCLPNEEIFAELARMGYEKPSTKLTFYKEFFSAQWKGLPRMNLVLLWLQLSSALPQAVEDAAEDEDEDNEVSAEPTPPSPTHTITPPPPQQESIPLLPQAESAQPSSPHQQQPSQTTEISMTLLNRLLETCATLTKQVANLEQDKVAQDIEITKLKQRVRRLEKKRQFNSSRLKRLRKVGIVQRVEPLADIVMDDQEDTFKQGRIAELDADEDVTLVDAEEDVNADAEPAKVEEVIGVVTTAKLMTEVVTTVATTITAAQVPKASAPRRRMGVVIQDPEETATASVIVHSKVKSKDKGKGILIEEPKPLKRQALLSRMKPLLESWKLSLMQILIRMM